MHACERATVWFSTNQYLESALWLINQIAAATSIYSPVRFARTHSLVGFLRRASPAPLLSLSVNNFFLYSTINRCISGHPVFYALRDALNRLVALHRNTITSVVRNSLPGSTATFVTSDIGTQRQLFQHVLSRRADTIRLRFRQQRDDTYSYVPRGAPTLVVNST